MRACFNGVLISCVVSTISALEFSCLVACLSMLVCLFHVVLSQRFNSVCVLYSLLRFFLHAFTYWVLFSCSLVASFVTALSHLLHLIGFCKRWKRAKLVTWAAMIVLYKLSLSLCLERYLRFPKEKSATVTIFLDNGCCVDDISMREEQKKTIKTFHCARFPKIDCIFIFVVNCCEGGTKKIKRINVATYHVHIMWILYCSFFFTHRNANFPFCSFCTFQTMSNFIYIPYMHMRDITENFAVTIRSNPSILFDLFFGSNILLDRSFFLPLCCCSPSCVFLCWIFMIL